MWMQKASGNQAHNTLRIITSLGILLSMCGAMPLPARQPNADFVVNSTIDAVDVNPGDGMCATSNGDCTLRAAIQETNALSGMDTIILPLGTYTLTIPGVDDDAAVGDLDIKDDLTIQGSDPSESIIDGNYIDRVLDIRGDIDIQLEDLTIRHGYKTGNYSSGGGIYILGLDANVVLTHCVVEDNLIDGSQGTGGGIHNTGILTLESSVVRDNRVLGNYGGGGGIYSNRILIVNNSTVTQNLTNAWAASGGGLFIYAEDTGDTAIISHSTISYNTVGLGAGNGAAGGIRYYHTSFEPVQVKISNSLILGNYADNAGGGIWSGGDLVITNTQIISNTSDGEAGGIGIDRSSFLKISDSTVAGNYSGGVGGGIATVNNGHFEMTNCRVASNFAAFNGGGIEIEDTAIIRDSVIEFNHAIGDGGGITATIDENWVTLENVVFHANLAERDGGGLDISYQKNISITNSTFSNNQAFDDGGGINIHPIGASIVLDNVTITDNYADTDNDGEGDGGGVSIIQSDVFMGNTILAGNFDLSAGSIPSDCSGTLQSQGYNLLGDSTGCNFIANIGDQIGTATDPIDPMLGPLQDNGGNTLTHALLPGSLAIDAIPVGACNVTTDQRGVSRPQILACDIGAFELQPLTFVKSVSNPTPTPGETLTYTLQVRNNLTETLSGGLISDTLPAGLNFLGPITLEPPLSGTVGSAPPTLVTDLEIGIGEQVTVTFPVSISFGLAGDTVIINTAWVTGSQVITPVLGSETITIANAPPVGVDDAGDEYTTAEDTPLTTGNVLDNDLDPNGDLLSIASYDDSILLGILTDNGDGSFDYDPNGQFGDLLPGEQAFDIFTYVVTDGVFTDTAVVTLTIEGVNSPPIAVDDSGMGYTTTEDVSFTTGDVLDNDIDPENDPLSVASYDASELLGILTDTGDGTFGYDPDGQFEYLAAGEQAQDSFSYVVSDGVLTDTASVTIAVEGVNDPPVALDDSGMGFTTTEDFAFTTGNLLDNDYDPDLSDVLSIESYADSGLLGILTDNGDGSFGYDPNRQFEDLFPGEEAFEVFTYLVTDGILTDTATVTITVTGVNDNPLVHAGPDQTVDEGEIVQFQGSASDPGLRLPSAVVGLLWDFGDGTIATGTLTPTHTYVDNEVYTVTLTVTDTYGGVASDGLLVTVENVSPTLSAFPDQEAIIGDPIALTGTISDPGLLDTQTVEITWSDGFTETQPLAATERQFTVTHVYAEPGEYLVMVRVIDKDGGWDQRSFVVAVNAPTIYLPYIQR